ncbi:helix-turn-helix transcriptional regulator [Nocardioides sp. Arc9.136]|uniref:helix-turn-helix transcriptional regulator n=1 Tax=Nocardioides sp. Arc9.136 TaxID=2996826 RepID=UPI0026670FC2|nr:helix-turn-helix transcriptional regulator [Nocardioides sp. Arc9.136]WKN48511.1 helix-turn-helix transcriptional regulator [Nocardioides sp. Arc9.136]
MDGRGAPPPAALGEFLRSRRARITPEDAGIVSHGARRVPGLRREELALLAGVSATYYTRLEQGQSTNASASVVDALARALALSEDERAHLHDLARPRAATPLRSPRRDHVRAGTRHLIEAMTAVPAVVLGRSTEVLAWNRLGHALVAGHVDRAAPEEAGVRPNLTRMLFLDPHTRELYADWDEEASRAVASLRLVAGRHTDDRKLTDLVGELCISSRDFARLWAKHPVHSCTSGSKRLDHPEIGAVELGFEVLHLPDNPGHRLLTYTAAEGSAAQHALALLDAVAREERPAPVRSRSLG